MDIKTYRVVIRSFLGAHSLCWKTGNICRTSPNKSGLVIIFEHGLKKMIERGITREMVDYYVEFGKAILQTSGVVTELGRLVTSWTAADFDEGMLEVIKLLFVG